MPIKRNLELWDLVVDRHEFPALRDVWRGVLGFSVGWCVADVWRWVWEMFLFCASIRSCVCRMPEDVGGGEEMKDVTEFIPRISAYYLWPIFVSKVEDLALVWRELGSCVLGS